MYDGAHVHSYLTYPAPSPAPTPAPQYYESDLRAQMLNQAFNTKPYNAFDPQVGRGEGVAGRGKWVGSRAGIRLPAHFLKWPGDGKKGTPATTPAIRRRDG